VQSQAQSVKKTNAVSSQRQSEGAAHKMTHGIVRQIALMKQI